MKLGSFAVMLLALAATGAPTRAFASSCVDEKIAPIRFAKGKSCWVYEGDATEFVGSFGAGQHVDVQMNGLAYSANGDSVEPEDLTVTWDPRSPDVSGPGNFYFGDAGADGSLHATLPVAGKYAFGFSPCAMWHAFGRVVICAR
jgi:hypothetical protein